MQLEVEFSVVEFLFILFQLLYSDGRALILRFFN